jgi:hypothetical protein
MKVLGEDGLCGLFGEPDIEAVDAAATSQVDHAQKLAAGMDFDYPLPASGNEKSFHQLHRLEDLQGARVDHGRSIPVERRSLRIDHLTGNSSAAQLGGKEQAGRAGSDDEHFGLMAWAVHRRKDMAIGGSCQTGYLLPHELSRFRGSVSPFSPP